MRSTRILAIAVIASIASLPSAAIELRLLARLDGGIAGAGPGASGGSYAAAVGERYADLGAASLARRGSYGAACPFAPGGGLGLELRFPPRLALALGIDYGLWGLGIIGYDSDGSGFASTVLTVPALDLSASLRYPFKLGPGSLEPSLGLLAGLLVGNYAIVERISGLEAKLDPRPLASDRILAGATAELAYALPFGPGRARAGLAAKGALALASAKSDLGDSILLPWRLGLRLEYAIKLKGAKR